MMKKREKRDMQKAFKRIFDVVFASLTLVALAPVWVVVAIWVAVTSPGGVFFRQKRTGYKGREFDLLKFRSMYVNNEADTRQADENDSRITPVGKFLRKSSIDELPQLWNVVKGDMSLIGPRPHMISETDYYSPKIKDYNRRHDMRPGLTGNAQVKGFRGATPTVEDMANRVNADLDYVDHFSLWFDLKILTLTVWKILTLKL